MPAPECVDCIGEGIMTWRPTTGKRVKRCATHVRAKKKESKSRGQDRNRERKYGLSHEDWEELLAEQSGLCAICGPVTGNKGQSKALCHDHDHKCCPGDTSCGGCMRGLLCSGCNTFIGRHAKDNPEVGLRMFAYLTDPPWQRVLRRRRERASGSL